ncbi:hypothetical protein HK097_011578, partial [Rhizophlyctis rosea]
MLKLCLWSGSCANVTCPSAMTDGAARLLRIQLDKPDLTPNERLAFQRAYTHLTSRDPSKAWTSGQWMTERPGGSDIRNTETFATLLPTPSSTPSHDSESTLVGPYSITGFKWFSSATDSQMTILLAKTSPTQISAFFAPTRLLPSSPASPPTLNGIQIFRLKSKLGTRPLPTAELTLTNTRAYMIGKPGQGTKEISTVLNITRIYTAVTAVGYWGRGLAIARAYARVRKITYNGNPTPLSKVPSHIRLLASSHIKYHALMHLCFFTVSLLAQSESTSKSPSKETKETTTLLRLLTPITKILCARYAMD